MSFTMLFHRLWVFMSCLCLLAPIGLSYYVHDHDQGLMVQSTHGVGRHRGMIHRTIIVDQSGRGHFRTIQSAIDSVPADNDKWVCIFVRAGTYREQVAIPYFKPFIYMKGDGKWKTIVVWDGHDNIVTGATLISEANNTLFKSMSFRNSYNNPYKPGMSLTMAVAARISGDKTAFYRCGFYGLQDTLWDTQGRHYFKKCTIQGAVDFIFGSGQSIYEKCSISVIAGVMVGRVGVITAQGRATPEETNGFVFKECKVHGSGLVYLGRPWRDYARVIFYNTSLSDVVVPEGWNYWKSYAAATQGNQITFSEIDCHGLGANKEKRVDWEAMLSPQMLEYFTSFDFIDNDGWIRKLPFNMLPPN